MNYRDTRWISYGIVLLATWGLSSCAGTSKATPSSPTVSLTATSAIITSGQSVTLNWQSSNANSVTITATAGSATRTVTTSSQASGSVKDSPTETTTYTAISTGAGGSSPPATAKVTVSAAEPQVTNLTVTPTAI